MKIDPRIAKLLKKKYKKKYGVKVGDSRKMMQQLRKGAKVSTYAKDGGYVSKKGGKVVKKRKKTKKK